MLAKKTKTLLFINIKKMDKPGLRSWKIWVASPNLFFMEAKVSQCSKLYSYICMQTTKLNYIQYIIEYFHHYIYRPYCIFLVCKQYFLRTMLLHRSGQGGGSNIFYFVTCPQDCHHKDVPWHYNGGKNSITMYMYMIKELTPWNDDN